MYSVKLASVDKGTHGFPGPKRCPDFVILVDGRQPICLVCLAGRRLCSGKTRRHAGRFGALRARQRTQAYWRKSRTITQPSARCSVQRAYVPLSTDAKDFAGFLLKMKVDKRNLARWDSICAKDTNKMHFYPVKESMFCESFIKKRT